MSSLLRTYIATWYQYHSHPIGKCDESCGCVTHQVIHHINYWCNVLRSCEMSSRFLYCLEWPHYNWTFEGFDILNLDNEKQLHSSFGGSFMTVDEYLEYEPPVIPKHARTMIFPDSALHNEKWRRISLSQVTSLIFSFCHQWGSIDKLFIYLPHLRRVHLKGYKLLAPFLNLGQQLQQLPDLRLEDTGPINDMEIDMDISFQHLSNVAALQCRRVQFYSELTDYGLVWLSNLQKLHLKDSTWYFVTDDGFRHLSRLTSLCIANNSRLSITKKAFEHMSQLKTLRLESYKSVALQDNIFRHLSSLRHLSLNWSDQTRLTDGAFEHLSQLTQLTIEDHTQTTLTDAAFQHVTHLRRLNLRGCYQSTLTDRAFVHLSHLDWIDVNRCTQLSDLADLCRTCGLPSLRWVALENRSNVPIH
jgi:hypothetical protein